MPHVERPDGARIYYEVHGSGFPLLLFAPGGINSEAGFWANSKIDAREYADEFMVIAMNQRHARKSPAPLEPPTWDACVADQLAVMDDAGAVQALVWGGCIGVAYALRLIEEAPERVAGVVGQDPVGRVEGWNSYDTFFAMFQPTIDAARQGGMKAVVEAAMENDLFVANNAAGPFAGAIAADEQVRGEVLALDVDAYEALIRRWNDQMWAAKGAFVSVEESFVPTIETPMLILPGNDPFHPTQTAERICREAKNAACLPVDCREPANIGATKERVREFLREHAR